MPTLKCVRVCYVSYVFARITEGPVYFRTPESVRYLTEGGWRGGVGVGKRTPRPGLPGARGTHKTRDKSVGRGWPGRSARGRGSPRRGHMPGVDSRVPYSLGHCPPAGAGKLKLELESRVLPPCFTVTCVAPVCYTHLRHMTTQVSFRRV